MNEDKQNFINYKMKMLNWANQFNIFCLLDNNDYSFETPAFECLLAVGSEKSFSFNGTNDFENLQSFYDKNPTWLFGHLGYNAAGNAYPKSNNTNNEFGNGFFFEPQILLKYTNGKIEVLKTNIDANKLLSDIHSYKSEHIFTSIINISHCLTKEKYIEKIEKLQNHIKRGDCYEINFCQQFIANEASINPIETYKKLTEISPAPFASLYKLNEQYCLCASPERFLQKKGMQLISQPIKGTSKRDKDASTDNLNKKHLQNSSKEKSENVMVVDLVRNDMSMICEKGSVKVKELFGIYSFPQVHQMISTIEGTLSPQNTFTQAIAACYPMGSMTGAPKQRVMQLIDEHEEQHRGLFSGSIGYINPQADFDFNVVIRSIFYDSTAHKIKFFAGSGITFYSNAAAEYEECLSKAAAIIEVLKD
jgi:para-aminobenzoate synthetase component I